MLIRVKVKPNSKRENFRKISTISFEIDVREKAKDNAANKKVIELLARWFGKKPVLIKGGHSSSKIFSIND